MKIGPLDNKQIGIQQEQAKQADQRQAETGSVEQSADSRALDERRRLAELADQKKQVEAARFERTNKDSFSASASRTSYSKEQLESGRLTQVKKRIMEGYYDQKDVVEKIADKLLEKIDFENESRAE